MGRQRAIYIGAAILSLAWLLVSFLYVDKAVGWGNFIELQPGEFGGLAGAAVLPLAVLWMFVAFLDRGTILRREAGADANLSHQADLPG